MAQRVLQERASSVEAVGDAPAAEGRSRTQLRRSLAGMSYEDQVAAVRPETPLQMSGASATGATEDVHRVAADGLSGSGGRLPYLERIQSAFGRHDVSAVQAHVGGRAAEASKSLGAEAYATGESTAFKSPPSLHTAAHEAAHVVQQRQGVSLPGGVGRVGDTYERHADLVADAVSKGQSAESLLDASPGGAGQAVQRATTVTPERQGWIDDPKTHPYYGTFMTRVRASTVPNNIGGRIWADAVRGIYKPDPAERQQHLQRMASFLRKHLTPPATGKVSFYSGRGARDEAARVGYNILEERQGAALFDDLNFVAKSADWVGGTPSAAEVRPLWATISTTFAQQVHGEVHTMLNRWSPGSVYVGDELKVLTDNGITPKYHAVASFPHDHTKTVNATAQIDASGKLTRADTVLGSESACRSAIDAWNSLSDSQRNTQWARLGFRTPSTP